MHTMELRRLAARRSAEARSRRIELAVAAGSAIMATALSAWATIGFALDCQFEPRRLAFPREWCRVAPHIVPWENAARGLARKELSDLGLLKWFDEAGR